MVKPNTVSYGLRNLFKITLHKICQIKIFLFRILSGVMNKAYYTSRKEWLTSLHLKNPSKLNDHLGLEVTLLFSNNCRISFTANFQLWPQSLGHFAHDRVRKENSQSSEAVDSWDARPQRLHIRRSVLSPVPKPEEPPSLGLPHCLWPFLAIRFHVSPNLGIFISGEYLFHSFTFTCHYWHLWSYFCL